MIFYQPTRKLWQHIRNYGLIVTTSALIYFSYLSCTTTQEPIQPTASKKPTIAERVNTIQDRCRITGGELDEAEKEYEALGEYIKTTKPGVVREREMLEIILGILEGRVSLEKIKSLEGEKK